MSSVERLIEFALTQRFSTLPGKAQRAANTFLRDAIAVAIAGSAEPSAVRLRQPVSRWGAATDGAIPDASILGTDLRAPAASAAYLNSFQVHCQEFDPLHEVATVHAMAVLTGPLLAVAEQRDLSGEDLLLGTALGVEFAVVLGLAAQEGLRFFRPATAGALGSTLALAALIEDDPEFLRNALGHCYCQLAGTMQAHVEGSVGLPLQVANGARAVMAALDLAEAGFTAPHDVLDGPFGYFELFERGGSLEGWLPTLGSPWRVTELSHKPYATGRAAHAVLSTIDMLSETHGITLHDVAEVHATVPPLIHRLVARPARAGMSVNTARLCLGFLLASLLRDGRIGPATFTPDRLVDEELLAFDQRLVVTTDNTHGPNVLSPQAVAVKLVDGRCFEVEVPVTLGSPGNPLSDERQEQKFRHCTSTAPVATQALHDALCTIATQPSSRALIALASGHPGGR